MSDKWIPFNGDKQLCQYTDTLDLLVSGTVADRTLGAHRVRGRQARVSAGCCNFDLQINGTFLCDAWSSDDLSVLLSVSVCKPVSTDCNSNQVVLLTPFVNQHGISIFAKHLHQLWGQELRTPTGRQY